MFGFLKKKLKDAVSKFSKRVDEASEKIEEVEEIEEKPEEVPEEIEEKLEEPVEEKEEAPEEEIEEKPKKKGFFEKIKERFVKKEEEIEKEIEEEIEKPEEIPKKEVREEEKPKREEITEELKKLRKEKEKLKKEKKEEEYVKVVELEKKKREERLKHLQKEQEEEHKKLRERVKPEEELPLVEEKAEEVPEEKLKEEKVEEKPEERVEEEAPEEEKKGIFKKIKEAVTKTCLPEKKFNDLFWDLEIVLLENNVAVEVIEKIKQDLRKELVDKKIPRGKINAIIKGTLKKTITNLFIESPDFLKRVKMKKPFVIAFVGINGSGKTTTIAKIANLLQKNDLKVVLAAADTFRAASIEQLNEHAKRLNVKMIRHDYGSDPAAVAFDAIKYAEAKAIDCVLIDTAGRLHSNVNLMDEMAKIMRVAKPNMKIFVGEALTGNDCVEQAKQFNEAVNVDGIILAKADVDEKGGAAISISYVTKKPILFIGTGQGYDDLEKFDKEIVLKSLEL